LADLRRFAEQIRDTAKLREEVTRLRARNRDLETIRENYEAEILKLRHRAFLRPSLEGERSYSHAIIDILQDGATWAGLGKKVTIRLLSGVQPVTGLIKAHNPYEILVQTTKLEVIIPKRAIAVIELANSF
jgi:sRNA-binding regulator protein Hfq